MPNGILIGSLGAKNVVVIFSLFTPFTDISKLSDVLEYIPVLVSPVNVMLGFVTVPNGTLTTPVKTGDAILLFKLRALDVNVLTGKSTGLYEDRYFVLV